MKRLFFLLLLINIAATADKKEKNKTKKKKTVNRICEERTESKGVLILLARFIYPCFIPQRSYINWVFFFRFCFRKRQHYDRWRDNLRRQFISIQAIAKNWAKGEKIKTKKIFVKNLWSADCSKDGKIEKAGVERLRLLPFAETNK